MPNTREKLIELIERAKRSWSLSTMIPLVCTFESWIADHLIANGVTIPVRCKDCKHCRICYPEKQVGKEATQGWYCKEHKSYRRPDDFCSYGERRADLGR